MINAFAPNYAQSTIGMFEAGANRARDMKERNAFSVAGKALSGGDYSGASNALLGVGNLEGGLKLQQYGDEKAAAAAAAKAANAQQSQQVLAQVMANVRQVPFEQRGMVMEQSLSRLGSALPDPSITQGLMRQIQANPQALSDAEIDQYLRDMQAGGIYAPPPVEKPLVVGGDSRVFDPRTGQVVLDAAPKTPGFERVTTAEGIFEYIPGQPESKWKIGDAPKGDASGGANVQSVFTGQDGQQYIVRRNGVIEPTGVFARNPFQVVDVGGVNTLIDRQSGMAQAITTPEQVGANRATIQTVEANEEARRMAQQKLPQAKATADVTLKAIDDLLSHPGFSRRYGLQSMGGIIPPIPEGEGAAAQAYIDQIGGAAFLQAFESLKGGGVITEVEGAKATQAITRLTNQSISPSEARKAALELRQIIADGVARLETQAKGAYAPQSTGSPNISFNAGTDLPPGFEIVQ